MYNPLYVRAVDAHCKCCCGNNELQLAFLLLMLTSSILLIGEDSTKHLLTDNVYGVDIQED